jgi:hypothetical protein
MPKQPEGPLRLCSRPDPAASCHLSAMCPRPMSQGSDVGNVQKVVIRHDNKGLAADWHLEQVRLCDAAIRLPLCVASRQARSGSPEE